MSLSRLRRRRQVAPELQEFAPVRFGRFLERGTDESNFVLIAIFSQCTPHQLKPQINEIGVGDVRFAVAANLRNFSILPCLPHLPAAHADLTGKPSS